MFQQDFDYPIINELVIKLASRCNIKCTYCYWFNDPLVMKSPKVLAEDVVKTFLIKLERHIQQHSLKHFSISFHGGEPTLFPKNRFESLCIAIQSIAARQNCQIVFSMQSNALLLDKTWVDLLKKFRVRLGISLDGSRTLHDKYRIDNKGRGTYQRTIEAIKRIRDSGLDVYILSVASNESDPDELLEHFVDDLNLREFDVLLPHIHYENEYTSLKGYFSKLFDRYLAEMVDRDVNIRIIDDLMCQILGGGSATQGYGFISTVTLLTDGKLEAIDDLRMVDGLPQGDINIKTHDLQEVTRDPLWREIYHHSIDLAPKCNNCEFKQACGGGPMVTRWSNKNRFNNPSTYCDDLQYLIRYMQAKLKPLVEQIQRNEASKKEVGKKLLK